MSSTSSTKVSLPKSVGTHCKAYDGGSRHPSKASDPPLSSPPKYSKFHLARSRASSSVKAAQNQLSGPSPPSSPAELQPARLRSDSLGTSLNASSSSSRPQCPESQDSSVQDATGKVAYADCFPPGFEVLPKCCYNYQPYVPPPSPAVLPWSRKLLISLIVSTCPPVFISCNLINPVHLASIIAPGCKWSVVEEIAVHMTPAVKSNFVETGDLSIWKKVQGVLVGGMLPEARKQLEDLMGRRHEEGYKRRVQDVIVKIKGGDEIAVAAYVYRKA